MSLDGLIFRRLLATAAGTAAVGCIGTVVGCIGTVVGRVGSVVGCIGTEVGTVVGGIATVVGWIVTAWFGRLGLGICRSLGGSRPV